MPVSAVGKKTAKAAVRIKRAAAWRNFRMLNIIKENKVRLLGLLAGAAVLFFIAPLILAQLPEETRATATLMILMIVNQIYMAVVGWQANYMGKLGAYVPVAAVALYLVSELVLYQGITFSLELNYLETGYIVYLLRKMILRRQQLQQKNAQKPFPKGLGRK